ncbi:LytTR family DNA-binding domain-containing protein [Spirosoma rhododendri]|uniref:LytTR family transcriptional regulator n=1 Tax=Spirosoma rhododendri TaxID=2728024 RepID=A0A7L5E0F2_9BACT|nr:LytTR family DNA-binding domain-containing protein [Spirosoma rhododendri]QJD81667.1 LytTR family transcriptional regulator [Spirosoma rhododendri]
MNSPSVSDKTSPPSSSNPVENRVKLAGTPAFDPASVIYLEGSGNYTIIHFTDGRRELVAMTLVVVAKQLPALLRVHKSYAIAVTGIGHLRWVGKVNSKRALVITMRNQAQIAVSRRRGAQMAPVLSQRTGIIIGQPLAKM